MPPLDLTALLQGLIIEKAAAEEAMSGVCAHLLGAWEEERAFFARETHGRLSQLIAAIKMDVGWVSRGLDPAGHTAHLRERLDATARLADEAVRILRQFAGDLRPGVLDEAGLGPAVTWYAAEFARRTQIRCNVKSTLDDRRPGPRATTIAFRILQETLTSVARHSGGTAVNVRLGRRHGMLTLQVSDNGRGFSDRPLPGGMTMGLAALREGAIGAAGALVVRRGREGATTVRASIPFEDTVRDEAAVPSAVRRRRTRGPFSGLD
jgi:signal transduction histidine kinase